MRADPGRARERADGKGGDWRRLRARLSRADLEGAKLLVGLDFDGTLAEIVDTPGKAALAAGTRRLLLALSRRPDTRVAILSGRGLSDVKRTAGVPGIYYAGNHGLEIAGPGMRWTHPRAKPLSGPLLRVLEGDFEGFPGVFLERKGLGAAVHYRRARPRAAERVGRRVRASVSRLGDGYRILRGKKTFDLRPDVAWDKGRALEKIRGSLPGVWKALLVGDDVTDEEAFATIGARALTIRIGRVRRSAAQYVLPDRRQVAFLLERLAGRRGRRRPSGHEAS